MVGMLSSISRERLLSLANSARTASEISSKLDYLRQLRRVLPHENPTLLSELLPRLFDLQTDRFAPVRKFATEIIGEVGVKHLEFLPEIVPVLMNVLDDEEPPVARQAITCGMDFFRYTLVEVAIQGLHMSELNDSLQLSWASMLELKDRIYSIAFQPGSGGVRLLALKFVEAVILLYTPDPNGLSEPPHDGKLLEFNISWIRKGHPVLNAGDLSIEASQKLVLLLDLLRFPAVKSISKLVIIVLVNSLSSIAKKRPAYFGRVLPVLLGLNPSSSATEGVNVSGACHVLRNAFLSCLKCTHPGAAPWKDRLSDALTELKAGKTADNSLHQVHNTNECGEEVGKSSLLIEEQKPSLKVTHATDSNVGRKRSGAEYCSDMVDNDLSGKRVKPTSTSSEESSKELDRNIDFSRDDSPSVEPTNNKGVGDSGPVLQLVAMFGALVAQGEKAVSSLEILISSISADLLAEVVMTNMRNLPLNRPHSELDDKLVLNTSIVGSETQAKYPSSFLAGVLSLSSSFPPIASLLSGHQSVSNDIVAPQDDEDIGVAALGDHTADGAETTHGTENEVLPISIPVSSVVLSGVEGVCLIPHDTNDIGNLESEIPGLDSSAHDEGLSETLVASSFASTDLEYTSQEQVNCSGERSPMEIIPSISTDRSEEHSPRAAILDSNSLASSTATSVGLPSHFVLPKMAAPVVNLADEQKDHLQILAYTRIVEAYKQIAVAGGSQLRFSLLAYLGVEFPLELDPWKLLQEHIFSDYLSHEGHELTLRVLHRLYREAEEGTDFFSSTTATSVYDMFIMAVAEKLRDSFPPSDKSLSRLLNEAPYLPKSILKLLECLCCSGNCEKPEKDLHGGDRVTQGLSTIWSLILVRPPLRDVCLKIALQSAVHHLEEVRMKAIRLVANKLYPMSSISQQIEDFANEMLISMIKDDAMERMDAEGSITESRKESDFENPSNEHHSVSAICKDVSSETHQSCTIQSESSLSMPEAQRCMSLYFALCTKKHSLFRLIFVYYERASNAVKQAIQRQIPMVVRTIGSSSVLLEIISDPPSGSENLLMQVLHTLTDGIVPSPELIFTIRKLFDSKLKDVEILIPVLPFLPRDEVFLVFPHFVNLSLEKFQAALARILQGAPHSGPVLDPAEVLIAIHAIDPERDGIPLKKVTDACNACFEQRLIFTQQVIAKVLNQLVEQIPLPLLFMRTVLQAIGAFPALVDFILEILARLVNKQIWKYPKLWVGFLKCAQLTKPQSFGVLLQLPPPQLENALNRIAVLKAPLVAHASQPDVRSSLPRSKLVVLGLASDPQSTSQIQTSQAETGDDSGNSDKEAAVEKTKESSAS